MENLKYVFLKLVSYRFAEPHFLNVVKFLNTSWFKLGLMYSVSLEAFHLKHKRLKVVEISYKLIVD